MAWSSDADGMGRGVVQGLRKAEIRGGASVRKIAISLPQAQVSALHWHGKHGDFYIHL